MGDVREKNREEVTGPEVEQRFARQVGGWIEGRAGGLRRRNRRHKGRVESGGVFGAARVQSKQSTEGTGGRVARGGGKGLVWEEPKGPGLHLWPSESVEK